MDVPENEYIPQERTISAVVMIANATPAAENIFPNDLISILFVRLLQIAEFRRKFPVQCPFGNPQLLRRFLAVSVMFLQCFPYQVLIRLRYGEILISVSGLHSMDFIMPRQCRLLIDITLIVSPIRFRSGNIAVTGTSVRRHCQRLGLRHIRRRRPDTAGGNDLLQLGHLGIETVKGLVNLLLFFLRDI